jgi:predicted transcriptional regulator
VAIYTNDFCKAFAKVLAETGVTCYKISQYSGLNEGYLSRLKSGLKENPSPETIIKICVAIVFHSKGTKLHDIEALFNATGRTLFHA